MQNTKDSKTKLYEISGLNSVEDNVKKVLIDFVIDECEKEKLIDLVDEKTSIIMSIFKIYLKLGLK